MSSSRPWVLHICGARPNFMKVAPIWAAIAARGKLDQKLLHTGQHYDEKMSEVFFAELGLPKPDIHLGVGSGTQAEQTAKVMVALEKVVAEQRPDLISVVGDVNSTLAAALVAAKAQIPLAHVEAGLRSFDRAMPEEINRGLSAGSRIYCSRRRPNTTTTSCRPSALRVQRPSERDKPRRATVARKVANDSALNGTLPYGSIAFSDLNLRIGVVT